MPEMTRQMNYRGKCVICGDSTVGKSSLAQVFISDGSQFPKTYLMTTGVDLMVKSISIPETADTVEMLLYDMAGKDAFDDVVQAHLHDIKMMMFVYDVTNEASFDNITTWYKKMEAKNSGKSIPGVLIGNKADLADRQVVTTAMGEELAEKLHLKYFECSGKDMRHTDTPFIFVATEFYKIKTEEIY